MNRRFFPWLLSPILLLFAGCPSSGGGDGGFGTEGVQVAYVANTGPNELSAYTINGAGALVDVGTFPLADIPSSIAVSSNGSFAFVATNDGIYAFTVNAATGTLTQVANSPFSSGGDFNAVTVSPNNRFLYAANNSGTVSAYTINGATGALNVVGAIAAGTTPSGMAVSPNGSFLYVSNQGSNNVSAFRINGTTGDLTFEENEPAGTLPSGVVVSPNSLFLYVSNQGTNNVSTFSINGTTGALTGVGAPVAAGTAPGGVAISPNGSFLYVSNQTSNNVSVFTIDGGGGLSLVENEPAGTLPSGITIEPDGQFVYVSNSGGGGNVSGYRITAGTGALVSLGAAFPAGTTPVGIATPGRP